MQAVVNAIGVEIRVAHNPCNCSNCYSIERRFFFRASRICAGMLFDILDRGVPLMRIASTSIGLRTTLKLIRRIYETGRNSTHEIKDQIRSTACFHKPLPKWNYIIARQTEQELF